MAVADRLYYSLMKIVAFITAAILIVLTGTVFANVLIRYLGLFPGGAMAWVDESARYMSIWLVFLGSVIAMDRRQHVSADFLTDIMPRRVQPWIRLLAELSILLFLTILTKEGLTLSLRVHKQLSPALGLSMSWVYLAIPIGSMLMIIVSLRRATSA